MMPTGTLSQKIQCQFTPCAIAPPTTGPMAMARPPIPPQAPKANGRRRAETPADRMVSVSGVTIAPPMPCVARARISIVLVGRQRSRRRAEREDDQADDEHAPPAKSVAQRGAREQQHGEGQRVCVDGPLELLEGRAQLGPNDRQGGGHHEVVEGDHEQGNRRDREGPGC